MTKYRIVPVPSTPVSFIVEEGVETYEEECDPYFSWKAVGTWTTEKGAQAYIWSRIRKRKELEEFKKHNPPYIYPPE